MIEDILFKSRIGKCDSKQFLAIIFVFKNSKFGTIALMFVNHFFLRFMYGKILKLFSVERRFWRMPTVIKMHDPCNL